MRRHLGGLTLVAALGLAACAGVPPESPRAAVLRVEPAAFTLEGRLALGDEIRAAHVGLYWASGPAGEELEFLSPLGQVLARVSWPPGGAARMLLPDGRVVGGEELDELMRQELGGALPLAPLRQWLLAVPRDEARVLELDAAGRPRRIAEQGWIVEYESYMDEGGGALPRILQGRSGGRHFRLVVASWELPR